MSNSRQYQGYDKEQEEGREDRVDDWNGLSRFFQAMVVEAGWVTAPDPAVATGLGTQIEQIEDKLKILGIVMAGMNLEVEADYMIERSWVGNPEEDDDSCLLMPNGICPYNQPWSSEFKTL